MYEHSLTSDSKKYYKYIKCILLIVKFILIEVHENSENSENSLVSIRSFVNVVRLGSKPVRGPRNPRIEEKQSSHESTRPMLRVNGDRTSRNGALTAREVPMLVLVAIGLFIRFYPPHYLSS